MRTFRDGICNALRRVGNLCTAQNRPAEVDAYVKSEIQKWGEVIRKAKVQKVQ